MPILTRVTLSALAYQLPDPCTVLHRPSEGAVPYQFLLNDDVLGEILHRLDIIALSRYGIFVQASWTAFFIRLKAFESWINGSVPLAAMSLQSRADVPDNLNVLIFHTHKKIWAKTMIELLGFRLSASGRNSDRWDIVGQWYMTFTHESVPGEKITFTTSRQSEITGQLNAITCQYPGMFQCSSYCRSDCRERLGSLRGCRGHQPLGGRALSVSYPARRFTEDENRPPARPKQCTPTAPQCRGAYIAPRCTSAPRLSTGTKPQRTQDHENTTPASSPADVSASRIHAALYGLSRQTTNDRMGRARPIPTYGEARAESSGRKCEPYARMRSSRIRSAPLLNSHAGEGARVVSHARTTQYCATQTTDDPGGRAHPYAESCTKSGARGCALETRRKEVHVAASLRRILNQRAAHATTHRRAGWGE
ncbi:hypothetical protein C8J57DRAFT_1504094 [Mycena rebaudengoi]|nr:hypothetical protein C8J57DRAFT_1504094 [Mycena rebaudengoi]